MNNSVELWKCIDIPEYQHYEISNLARIRNKNSGYMFNTESPSQKYIQILLSSDNKTKGFFLHRLVAKAFVFNPNPTIYRFVDHIDGNTRNNKAENLEWVTSSENKQRSNTKRKDKLTNSQNEIIELLDDGNNVIKSFRTTQECAEHYNCGPQTIQYITRPENYSKKNRKKESCTTETFSTIDMYEDDKIIKTFGPGKKCRQELAEHLKTLGYGFSRWVIYSLLRDGKVKSVPKKYSFKFHLNVPNLRLQNKELLVDEVWKDVPGYEGYIISNYGKLRNVKSDKELKGTDDGRYIRVQFFRKKHEALHRLVAMAFIENPEQKDYVNHIDSNTYNNCVTNLEWVTQKENMLHSVSKGRHQTARKICQYDKNGSVIRIWDSAKQIEKELNIHHDSIIKMCRGIFPKRSDNKLLQSGFIFKYVDDFSHVV